MNTHLVLQRPHEGGSIAFFIDTTQQKSVSFRIEKVVYNVGQVQENL